MTEKSSKIQFTGKQKKVVKKVIEKEYLQYILDCMKSGTEALPPDDWIKKRFKKRSIEG